MEIPLSGVKVGDDGKPRCWWCLSEPIYIDYHDNEWGRPIHDDERIFEQIVLEGFQSGLSWLIILRKRENFRMAFDHFALEAVARYTPKKVEELLRDPGIVRHRGKIESAINNAQRALDLIDETGSLDSYLRSFSSASTRPKALDWPKLLQIGVPDEAKQLSKSMRKRGWSYAGPTTIYSVMEAMGIVNDHMSKCSIRREVEAARTGSLG